MEDISIWYCICGMVFLGLQKKEFVMHTIFVDYGKFPSKVQTLIRRFHCVDESLNIVMDADLKDGGWIIFARDNVKSGEKQTDEYLGWLHPAILLLHNSKGEVKPYAIEERVQPNQDGSDLEWYQEIIQKARAGAEKDEETCQAINTIHDRFVIFLACLNYANIGSDAQKRHRRGRIQLAKFTACRIWQEGKSKKLEPEKDSTHE